jgi:NADH-quinone oxidoreductase subunit H
MLQIILYLENYYIIVQFLGLIAMLLVSVGIITLIERKILGNIQYRVGPSFTSFFGILQPIMDGFKLFIKESILPILSQEDTYVNATCLSFFLSIFC